MGETAALNLVFDADMVGVLDFFFATVFLVTGVVSD